MFKHIKYIYIYLFFMIMKFFYIIHTHKLLFELVVKKFIIIKHYLKQNERNNKNKKCKKMKNSLK